MRNDKLKCRNTPNTQIPVQHMMVSQTKKNTAGMVLIREGPFDILGGGGLGFFLGSVDTIIIKPVMTKMRPYFLKKTQRKSQVAESQWQNHRNKADVVRMSSVVVVKCQVLLLSSVKCCCCQVSSVVVVKCQVLLLSSVKCCCCQVLSVVVVKFQDHKDKLGDIITRAGQVA